MEVTASISIPVTMPSVIKSVISESLSGPSKVSTVPIAALIIAIRTTGIYFLP